MADRHVTQSGKDEDGDITKLCNPSALWSPREKDGAISDIETGLHTYYVKDSKGNKSNIHVVKGQTGKYLRTDPDEESADNLDNLPDC